MLATGISIAISLYQFFLLANLLERLARTQPGMKGVLSLFLIILTGILELAFIYTRFPHYRKCKLRYNLMRSFLLITLAQAYLLVVFVAIRLVVLAGIFGISPGSATFRARSYADTALFCVALVVAGICQGLRPLVREDNDTTQ